ncbi:MAG: hypothetical protein ABIH83_03855 [Candidatus Micrarchaeota archaeon]
MKKKKNKKKAGQKKSPGKARKTTSKRERSVKKRKKASKSKGSVKIQQKEWKGINKPEKVKKKKQEGLIKKQRKRERMNDIWVNLLLRDPRVRKWLVQMVGEYSIHVIQEFNQEMSDEELAKKSNIRASDVRVVLNRLHSSGLASYSRSRDRNSGWYSYIWRLDNKHAKELADGVGEIINEKEMGGVGEEAEYYYCPKEGVETRVRFEVALEQKFKCISCGGPLKYLEQKKKQG